MISDLHLINFRNHRDLKLVSKAHTIIISGENGVGKTNILEAISLLAPGRSMKNCKLDEIITHPHNIIEEWGIHATVNGDLISTGYRPRSLRKIKKNQEALRSQSDILSDLKILWLLPQMEGVFTGASSNRRKFLDRICYNLFPDHAKSIVKYEFYLASRMKLLQQNNTDDYWLKSIEMNLATLTKIINLTRINTINTITEYISGIDSKFLHPILELKSSTFNYPNEENHILECFKANRELDRRSKRSNFGAHKEDLLVTHNMKNRKAELCSTGEQKSILVAIMIAQARAIKAVCNIAPIMLMDEVLAHFDLKKQINILEELCSLSSQVWITTIKDNDDLESIYKNNSFLLINLY